MINLGTIGIAVAAVVALFVLWQGDRASQRSKGASAVVAKIEQKANANAKKADAARRTADKLTDAELHDRHFRAD